MCAHRCPSLGQVMSARSGSQVQASDGTDTLCLPSPPKHSGYLRFTLKTLLKGVRVLVLVAPSRIAFCWLSPLCSSRASTPLSTRECVSTTAGWHGAPSVSQGLHSAARLLLPPEAARGGPEWRQ